ncbi:MAG TPA: DoxX family membrane protein [Polyangiaceae bacterium]|nr:DoxX family membrane protein [Polyangiaceae bacterium]
MAPLIVLVSSFVLFRLAGLAGISALDETSLPLRIAVASMFLLTASAHWGKRRADLVRMVPARIPRPELVVTVTGVLELVGAVGMLVPATAPYAAVGLALLLGAMFPANMNAARAKLSIGGRPVTPLPQRSAMQLVFLAAVLGAGSIGC